MSIIKMKYVEGLLLALQGKANADETANKTLSNVTLPVGRTNLDVYSKQEVLNLITSGTSEFRVFPNMTTFQQSSGWATNHRAFIKDAGSAKFAIFIAEGTTGSPNMTYIQASFRKIMDERVLDNSLTPASILVALEKNTVGSELVRGFFQSERDKLSLISVTLPINLDDIITSIDNVISNINTINGQITVIDGKIVSIQGNITTLQQDILNLGNNISLLAGRLSVTETDIIDLKYNNTLVAGQIATINTNIQNLVDRQDTSDTHLTLIDAQILDLYNRVAFVDTDEFKAIFIDHGHKNHFQKIAVADWTGIGMNFNIYRSNRKFEGVGHIGNIGLMETITLDNGDIQPRYDVIVIDTLDVVSVIKGTPSSNPEKPVLNDKEYQEISTIRVNAGAVLPSNIIRSEIRDDEFAGGWGYQSDGLTAGLMDDTNPYRGVYASALTDITDGSIFQFVNPTLDINYVDFDYLRFNIALKTTVTHSDKFGIKLRLLDVTTNTPCSDFVEISADMFDVNFSNPVLGDATDYGFVGIPQSYFKNVKTKFNGVQWYFYGNNEQGYLIDDVAFIKGLRITHSGKATFDKALIDGEIVNASESEILLIPTPTDVGGGGGQISKTKAEIDALIASNSLVVGSTYKISGVHKDLYADKPPIISGGVPTRVGTGMFDPDGSGYVDGSYINIPATGGNGTGLMFTTIDIVGGSVSVWNIPLNTNAIGYITGDIISIDPSSVGGTGSGFELPIVNATPIISTPDGDGITIYLQALTPNTLSKNGHGEFWNPKYNKEIDGFGIWDNRGTWDTQQYNSQQYEYIVDDVSSLIASVVYDSVGNIYTIGSDGIISKVLVDGSVIENFSNIGIQSGSFVTIDNDIIYITTGQTKDIHRVDSSTGTHSILATIPTPSNLTRSVIIDGFLYVISTTGGNSIYKVNIIDGTNSELTAINENAINLLHDTSDNLFVPCNISLQIKKIDLGGTTSVFWTADGAISSIGVSVIDPDDFIWLDTSIGLIKISPDGSHVVIPNSLPIGGISYMSLGVDGILFVVGNDGKVYEINTSNLLISTIYSITDSIWCMTYYPPTNMILLGGYLHLYRIDLNNTIVIPAILFHEDEEFVTNTGSTGSLIGLLENGRFVLMTGSMIGVTTISGISSGGLADVSNILATPSSIGGKTIWGGYSWVNVSGNIGNYVNKFQLSSDWSKNPYALTDYNKSIDIIEYDHINDWISRRYDPIGNIDVKYMYIQRNMGNDGEDSSIPYMMYGNSQIDGYDGAGVSDIYVDGGCVELINFIGSSVVNVKSKPYSYLNNCTFNKNCTIGNLTLDSNATINDITFGINSNIRDIVMSDGSSMNRIELEDDSSFQFLSMNQNSQISDMTIPSGYGFWSFDMFRNSEITNVNFADIKDTSLLLNASNFEVFRNSGEITKIRYFNADNNLVIADLDDEIDD
jgi:hypothetical protein